MRARAAAASATKFFFFFLITTRLYRDKDEAVIGSGEVIVDLVLPAARSVVVEPDRGYGDLRLWTE